ncbi:MAG: hypothetical protein ACT4OZ_13500 [Gemmatimonadota bacterium]
MPLKAIGRRVLSEIRLSPLAREERSRDRTRPLEPDPGPSRAIEGALAWLQAAQDNSLTSDGGVAHSFSVLGGWTPSYPETTGYIVPTMLDCATRFGRAELRQRALRMLDWLVSIQLGDGGFQGGVIGATPVVPVTFNTGQILLGLAAGAREDVRYAVAMERAAQWLATTQDADGCWRRFRTPFAGGGDKTYETHVSWGLYEALRVQAQASWLDAANSQVEWALRRQLPNGWFEGNCLDDNDRPLTHAIGYALRGILEAWRFTGDVQLLDAAERAGRGAIAALGPDGRLPGRIDRNWRGAVPWVCLTGSVQIAHCWLMLYKATGDQRFLDAGRRANSFVRRTIRWSGDPGMVGGVKGSLPVDGGYMTWALPNWAAKFLVDSNLLESDIAGE